MLGLFCFSRCFAVNWFLAFSVLCSLGSVPSVNTVCLSMSTTMTCSMWAVPGRITVFLQFACMSKHWVSVSSWPNLLLPLGLLVSRRHLCCLCLFEAVAQPSCTSLITIGVMVGYMSSAERKYTPYVFLRCFRQTHQEVFGIPETMTMMDFLMLLLKGALHKPWMVDVVHLRSAVAAGSLVFSVLREVAELISVWQFVRKYVRYTGSQHKKSEVDSVI